jgi:hypothetical protein
MHLATLGAIKMTGYNFLASGKCTKHIKALKVVKLRKKIGAINFFKRELVDLMLLQGGEQNNEKH